MSDVRVFSGCLVGAMLDVRLVLVWILRLVQCRM